MGPTVYACSRTMASASSTLSTVRIVIAVDALLRLVGGGDQHRLEAQLGRFADAFLAPLHRPDFPCQPDLAKHYRFSR